MEITSFDNVGNTLEFKKKLTEVESRIKDNITSDYTLASLNDQDKEAIIEMTDSAYYAQRIIQKATEKFHKYTWNEQKQNWTLTTTPNETEQKRILTVAQRSFDAYMIKLNMVTILNRNKKGNYLIEQLLGNTIQEEEDEEHEKQLLDKIKDKLKPRGEPSDNKI